MLKTGNLFCREMFSCIFHQCLAATITKLKAANVLELAPPDLPTSFAIFAAKLIKLSQKRGLICLTEFHQSKSSMKLLALQGR